MKTKTLTVFIVCAMALIMLVNPCASVFAEPLFPVDSIEVAPQNVSVEVKEWADGKPYFQINWKNPQSIIDTIQYWDENGEAPLCYELDMKVGNGLWSSETGSMSGNSLHAGDDESEIFDIRFAEYDPINSGVLANIDIKSNVYSFRVKYSYDTGEDLIYSPFSNIAQIGSEEIYKMASDWAKNDLNKAAQYGLITDRIKDNMSGPITREEFAELATRLYEVYTGNTALPAPVSTFTDTTNPEILKAYNLGIVAGVGNEKYAPQVLINREQMAAMLNRAAKVINPGVNQSIDGAPSFTDENAIESYFVNNVKFMAKNGLMGSVGNNRFAPKDNCTREQAVLIALRLYEKYK